MSSSWSRRRFLKSSALVGGVFVVGIAADEIFERLFGGSAQAASASPSPTFAALPPPSPSPQASLGPGSRAAYRSRPDLTPLVLSVTTPPNGAAPGYLFMTPSYNFKGDGASMYDEQGEPIWLNTRGGNVAAENFRVSTYMGAPVLTWWEGTVSMVGLGIGEYVIADQTYRELVRFGAGNGLAGDLHEFLITPQNTALITSGRVTNLATPATVQPNASAAPAPISTIWEGVVQEIDIASQKVLLEWHSLDHIDITESHQPLPTTAGQPWDYAHLNSVDVDLDGNLLISARHTFAVYKIDRSSGAVIWQLGGTKSDFTMGSGTSFAWQHDARRQADGSITLFDDNAAPNGSRGLMMSVDETAHTASLVKAYSYPSKIQATSQGNVQVLPNGDVMVGWGSLPNVTEFSRDGGVRFDAALPQGGSSYRSFRFPWTGRPTESPAIALDLTQAGTVTAYASWNGATEVATWELTGGDSPTSLNVISSAPRTGFETSLGVSGLPAFVAARAKDAAGNILGTTPVVATSSS